MTPAAETVSRIGPYVERLAANQYLHDNLGDAVANLRAAYGRASKRQAAAAQDKVFYRRLRQAADSLSEARAALVTGRQKPKRSKTRIAVVVLAGGALAGAITIAYRDELRHLVGRGGITNDATSPDRTAEGPTNGADSAVA